VYLFLLLENFCFFGGAVCPFYFLFLFFFFFFFFVSRFCCAGFFGWKLSKPPPPPPHPNPHPQKEMFPPLKTTVSGRPPKCAVIGSAPNRMQHF